MNHRSILPALALLLLWLVSGCQALPGLAPLPEATAIPTPTTVLPTSSPLPTLGKLEYLNAVYCLDPALNAQISGTDEINLLRLFSSGVILDVFVANQGDCRKSWEAVKEYLVEDATDVFSHGRYELSGAVLRYTVSPPGSDQPSGTVSGRREADRLILQKQGVELIYILIYSGE